MLVHFVTDELGKIPAIRAMLEPRYHVAPKVLGIGDTQITSGGVLMVDADLRMRVRVEQIRFILQEIRCISEKLFVVRNHVRSMVEQAYALGATAVVSRPKEIISKLAQIEVAEKAALTDFPITSHEIADGAAAFSSMFSAARRGKPINLSDAERPTSQIIDNIAQNGLSVWLDYVRRYHEGTYQHCLLVMGVRGGQPVRSLLSPPSSPSKPGIFPRRWPFVPGFPTSVTAELDPIAAQATLLSSAQWPPSRATSARSNLHDVPWLFRRSRHWSARSAGSGRSRRRWRWPARLRSRAFRTRSSPEESGA